MRSFSLSNVAAPPALGGARYRAIIQANLLAPLAPEMRLLTPFTPILLPADFFRGTNYLAITYGVCEEKFPKTLALKSSTARLDT
jgi:hypothetical protein